MKIPVALTMLASPFSLPHDERWILPIALGFFALLTVYFTWRLKADVLNRILGGQVFITCCEEDRLGTLLSGKVFHIADGKVV